MKIGVHEKCVGIIALYECGMTAKMICRMLKLLSVNKRLAHNWETDDVVDCPRDWCSSSVHTQQNHSCDLWMSKTKSCMQARNVSLSKWTSASVLWVVFCENTYALRCAETVCHLLRPIHTGAPCMHCATRAQATNIFLRIHVHLDQPWICAMLLAATAHDEPNFVGFCTNTKGILCTVWTCFYI